MSEFKSIAIVLDGGRRANSLGIHQKMVFSTDDAVEALFNIINYYGDVPNASTVQVIQAAQQNAVGAMFAYAPTKGPVHAILDAQAFAVLVSHPAFGNGSTLETVTKLAETLQIQFDNAREANGGITPPLLGIGVELAAADRTVRRRNTTKARNVRKAS